jgi:hypothetical protein
MWNFSDMHELFFYLGNSPRDISANVFEVHSLFSEIENVFPDIR